MRTVRAFAVIAVAGFLAFSLAGCPGTPRPDLVVTSFEATGLPEVNGDGDVEVPVSVTVENQGNASAGVFKVAVYFEADNLLYVMPFTVPGETDEWYPYTDVPLPEGESVTFEGTITFTTIQNLTLDVFAEADSCSGDEFLPSFCRVFERNEANNFSDPIEVDVP